jgi:hypothetical protein
MKLNFGVIKEVMLLLEKSPYQEIFHGHKDDEAVSHCELLMDKGFICAEKNLELNNQVYVVGTGPLPPQGKELCRIIRDDPSNWEKKFSSLIK